MTHVLLAQCLPLVPLGRVLSTLAAPFRLVEFSHGGVTNAPACGSQQVLLFLAS